MKPTSASLIRWTGLAAMGAGIIFAVIQPIHPLDVLESVTTTRWVVIQSFKFAMCFLGLFAMVGLYARQVKETGWLGLAGYLLFSLFYALTSAFVFLEAFVLPLLATQAPKFIEGFLSIINGATSEVSLGALPLLYAAGTVGYVLGGLLFGIAMFRAHVLPRWATALFAAGAVLPLVLGMLPHPLNRTFAVPMGVALVGLGYALWSERRAPVAQPLPGEAMAQLRPSVAK
jgi:hypothetical protein